MNTIAPLTQRPHEGFVRSIPRPPLLQGYLAELPLPQLEDHLTKLCERLEYLENNCDHPETHGKALFITERQTEAILMEWEMRQEPLTEEQLKRFYAQCLEMLHPLDFVEARRAACALPS